ncbi:MAG: hypothetical protein V1799_07745 [bacterium]
MGLLDPVKNFAKVTVSTGYDAAATSIVLSSGHGASLPAPATEGAFNLVWWNSSDYADPSDDPNKEIVRCTARSTDTLTITRAQEGTSASTKNTSAKTYRMILAPTKKMIDDIDAYLLSGAKVTCGETLVAGDIVKIANVSSVAKAMKTVNSTFAVSNSFANASGAYTKIVRLTDTTFFTVYKNTSGVQTVIGTLNGTSLTYGTAAQLSTRTLNGLGLVFLTSTLVIILESDTTAVYATAVSISGTTITLGTTVTIEATAYASTNKIKLGVLNASSFVAIWRNTSGYPASRVCTVSGTTITMGTTVVVYSENSETCLNLIALDSTHFAVIYGTQNTYKDYYTKVASVSGTTITYGSAMNIDVNDEAAQFLETEMVALSSSLFVVVGKFGSQGMWYSSVSVSGTTCTLLQYRSYNEADYSCVAYWSYTREHLMKLNSTTVGWFGLVRKSYYNGTNTTYVYNRTLFLLTVTSNGDAILKEYPFTVSDVEAVGYFYASCLTDNKIGLVYSAAGEEGAYYTVIYREFVIDGMAVIKDREWLLERSTSFQVSSSMPVSMIELSPYRTVIAIQLAANTYKHYTLQEERFLMAGIMQEGGSTNAVARMAIVGHQSTIHSGLSIGRQYYLDAAGALTLNPTDKYVGIALSATTILII